MRTRKRRPTTRPSAAAAAAAAAALAGPQPVLFRARAPAPLAPPPYILWEVSRDCPLGCGSCRHSSLPVGTSRDLTTDESVRFIDGIAHSFRPGASGAARTSLVLSGPEPLVRPDLFDLADYARTREIPVALATNAARFDVKAARRAVEVKIRELSISLDGSSGRAHDGFRALAGAFTQTVKGLELAKLAGIRFRISTTVTQQNVHDLPKILALAQKLGAAGYSLFYNIPVGRGVHLPGDPLSDSEYMESLNWVFEQETKTPGYIHLQCSPQYERIYRQRAHELPDHMNPFKPGNERRVKDHGCPAGRGFLFVSHDGYAYPCPYLLVPAGHVLEQELAEIWESARILNEIRDPGKTGGKCQRCKFLNDCRGCRALAQGEHRDYLAEDPSCRYIPGTGA
jgi:radical SAM protein with 4Fe4S-binding SPASM domain